LDAQHQRIWVSIDVGKGHPLLVAVGADGETVFSTKVNQRRVADPPAHQGRVREPMRFVGQWPQSPWPRCRSLCCFPHSRQDGQLMSGGRPRRGQDRSEGRPNHPRSCPDVAGFPPSRAPGGADERSPAAGRLPLESDLRTGPADYQLREARVGISLALEQAFDYCRKRPGPGFF
jgi:hypothetical protein